MKNLKKPLAAFMAIALACASCQVDDNKLSNTTLQDGEITFLSEIGTRATDTNFEDGDQISVTAYSSSDSVYISDVAYSYSNSLFSSTTPLKYESDTQQLSFRALYPYTETSASGDFTFKVLADQSATGNYTLSDLMSSYTEATQSTSPVLKFNHLLSRIVLTITSTDVALEESSATILACSNSSYNLITSDHAALGEKETITMALNGVNSYKAIIAPQEFEGGVDFGCINAGGVDYHFNFSTDKTLKAGIQYEFQLAIKDGSISFSEPIINDWLDDDVTVMPDSTVMDSTLMDSTLMDSTLMDSTLMDSTLMDSTLVDSTVMDSTLVDSTVIDSKFTSLADYSATSYPTESNDWIIEDAEAATSFYFAGLKAALQTIDSLGGRSINLTFPNLGSFPDSAFYIENVAIDSISAPKATVVGNYAFACSSITAFNLPLVDEVGSSAFFNCDNLTSVSLPEATTIGERAFLGCDNLTTLLLPKAVVIEDNTFNGCTSLTDITLPAATSIEGGLFIGCSKLQSISAPAATKIDAYAFYGCNSLYNLEVASNEGVVLTQFGYSSSDLFDGIDISYMTLTTSSANSSMVNGLYLNAYTDKTYGPFKEIVIVN